VLNQLESKDPSEQVLEWLNTITDPSFGLVASLVKTFLEKMDNIDYCKELIIVIRQLTTHVAEKV
jgi:hypothetical protein